MNHEGYSDKTADKAVTRVMREPSNHEVPDAICFMVKTFRNMASMLGYDISGRITFVDKKTGKRWE